MKSATGNNPKEIIPAKAGIQGIQIPCHDEPCTVRYRAKQSSYPLSFPNALIGNPGFTFVEVMVSLVVLCSGIVLIYKSFFLCADYLQNLTCRLYASTLIDEKIGEVARAFAEWPAKPLDFGPGSVTVDINHKPVVFTFQISPNPLADVPSVWQVNVQLSWVDGPRHMHAQRSAYMLR